MFYQYINNYQYMMNQLYKQTICLKMKSATSSLRRDVVKKLERLGKSGEMDIFASLQNLPERDVMELRRLLGGIGELLPKEKQSLCRITHHVNRRDKVAHLLKTLNKTLSEYETNDEIEEWGVDINVNEVFQIMSEQQLLDYNKKLLKSHYSLNNIKLLLHYERGRFYSFMRNRHFGNWRTFCRASLQVCANTALCHIDFYKIVQAYPRLLISQISFESITAFKKEILDYIKRSDNDLAERLKLPLREIETNLNVTVPSAQGIDADMVLDFEGDMAAGWELEHVILDERESIPSNVEWFDADGDGDGEGHRDGDGDRNSIYSGSDEY